VTFVALRQALAAEGVGCRRGAPGVRCPV